MGRLDPSAPSPNDQQPNLSPSHQATSVALTLSPSHSATLSSSRTPFLVYFSGVGDISDVYQSRYEDELLDAVKARVPNLVVITDVFGFSVDNLSMTSQRRLGWFWSWVNDVRLRKDSPFKRAGLLINLRNILHVSVSADSRYGPVYNYSVAEMVLQSLVRHGYVVGSGAPVAHMGFSGGGQMALATAGTVAATLRAPVQVIGMGGIMNANPSLSAISRLTLLYGTNDHVQSLSDWIFPARWPLLKNSAWNRALRCGQDPAPLSRPHEPHQAQQLSRRHCLPGRRPQLPRRHGRCHCCTGCIASLRTIVATALSELTALPPSRHKVRRKHSPIATKLPSPDLVPRPSERRRPRLHPPLHLMPSRQ